jgi:large subunit ribosomal protein L17
LVVASEDLSLAVSDTGNCLLATVYWQLATFGVLMSSHKLFGRQLSRDSEHRTAMRRNLVQSLFEHGKVRTTMPKAKEVRAMAEKMITLSRLGTINARRKVTAMLNDRRLVDDEQEFTGKTVVQKLFEEIAPKFMGRPGGYTRIIKTGDWRIGDAGDIVLLQLADETLAPSGTARRSSGLRKKRSQRKHQFAKKALKSSGETATTEPPTTEPPATEPPATEPAAT